MREGIRDGIILARRVLFGLPAACFAALGMGAVWLLMALMLAAFAVPAAIAIIVLSLTLAAERPGRQLVDALARLAQRGRVL